MNTNPKYTVVLKLPKQVSGLIRLGRGVVTGLTGNHDLPSPTVAVATLQSQVDALDLAETLAHSRARGTAQARNAAKNVLVTSLKLEMMYVQSVVDANLERGDAIARSAGMSVKARAVRIKPDLAAKNGAIPGSAQLVAKSQGRQTIYQWQMSTDQGHTWTDLLQTMVPKTTVPGLTHAQTYAFRYRTQAKAGVGAWSDAVTLLVA